MLNNPVRIGLFSAGFIFILLLFLFYGCGHPLTQLSPLAPTVTAVFPTDKGTSAIDTIIYAVFDRDMDKNNINTATFSISSAEGVVTGSVSYDAASRRAILVPAGYLTPNITYTATISAMVKSTEGAQMVSNFSWSFMPVRSGIPDTSFGTNGLVTYLAEQASGACAVALDASGRIYLTGFKWAGNGLSTHSEMILCCYNANGDLDSSFDSDGIATYIGAAGTEHGDFGYAVATDAAGKILVVGDSYSSALNKDLAAWRYKPDGSLDQSFATNGIYVFDQRGKEDIARAVFVDPNGKILIAGESNKGGGIPNGMLLIRLDSSGSPDATFNNGKFVYYSIPLWFTVGNSIAVDSSEKILVAGRITKDPSQGYNSGEAAVWRYNSNGTLDNTFGAKNMVIINDGAAYAVKADASGRILVAGESYDSGRVNMALWLLNADGTINKSTVYHASADQQSSASSLTIDPSGKILIAGKIGTDTISGMAIWRYNSDGNIDPTFGSGGVVVYNDQILSNTFGNSLVLDSQNRIVVGGFAGAGSGLIGNDRMRMALWRYK